VRRAVFLLFAALLGACASTQTTKGGLVPYAAAGVTADAAAGRRLALVIGTNDYADPLYKDLRYAVADALAVGSALAHYDYVEVLTTPDETTQISILAALDRLAAEVRGPTDTVVVYVSGHGTLGRAAGGPLERYIVSSDADSRDIDRSGVAVVEVVQTVESLRAQRKGIVLATCYNGQSKSALTDALASELASQKGSLPPLIQRSEAMIVTSAASWGEAAIEDANLEHDVYTWFLLEGLEKGDRDLDGAVTLTEAHDYARDRTYGFTEGRQRPSARAVVLGRDPIVLAGDPTGAPPPLLYSYDDGSDGLTVVLDGFEKGALPGAIPVESGVHRLHLTDGDGKILHSKKIRLEKGDRVSLTDIVRPGAELAVRPGAQLWIPLDATSDVWPTAMGPGLTVQWRPASTPLHLLLGGGLQGSRDVGASDHWGMTYGDLGVAWSLLEHPVFDVRPQVALGAVHGSWDFPLGWSTQVFGSHGGAGVQLSARPFGGAEVVLDARIGASAIDLSDAGVVHPTARAGMTAGWVF